MRQLEVCGATNKERRLLNNWKHMEWGNTGYVKPAENGGKTDPESAQTQIESEINADGKGGSTMPPREKNKYMPGARREASKWNRGQRPLVYEEGKQHKL